MIKPVTCSKDCNEEIADFALCFWLFFFVSLVASCFSRVLAVIPAALAFLSAFNCLLGCITRVILFRAEERRRKDTDQLQKPNNGGTDGTRVTGGIKSGYSRSVRAHDTRLDLELEIKKLEQRMVKYNSKDPKGEKAGE